MYAIFQSITHLLLFRFSELKKTEEKEKPQIRRATKRGRPKKSAPNPVAEKPAQVEVKEEKAEQVLKNIDDENSEENNNKENENEDDKENSGPRKKSSKIWKPVLGKNKTKMTYLSTKIGVTRKGPLGPC